MTIDVPPGLKLRSLPVQLIQLKDGVLLKRGCLETKICGDGATEAVCIILEQASRRAITREELCRLFAAPNSAAVLTLVDKLVARRLLVPANQGTTPLDMNESSLEVFYWNFGAQGLAEISRRMDERRIVILGVNSISRQLVTSLAAANAKNFEVVHYSMLCNLRFLDAEGGINPEHWPASISDPLDYDQWAKQLEPESIGCLVATSDFGGMHLMRVWNQYCVEHRIHFLPIVLQDLVGYVGPLVVPGETACFECLRARQNSHMPDPELQRAAEYESFAGQRATGFHPAMASILGDLAALELTRFYGGWAPQRIVGTLIEANLLSPEVKARKVLKIPRCQVCSSLVTKAAVNLNKEMFLPGNEPQT